jgi:nucleoside-diphosphate-sugar epimerase
VKVGIIGHKGFLGNAIHNEVNTRGYLPIPLDRTSKIVTKLDIVINANGNSKKYISEIQPLIDFQKNVQSTATYLLETEYSHYLHISSSEVYGSMQGIFPGEAHECSFDSLSNYGFTKKLSELLVQRYAPNWSIFRLGGLIGQDQKKGPVFDLMNQNALRVSPRSTFQFLTTTFAARAIIDVLETEPKNEIFNLASNSSDSIAAVASELGLKPIYAADAHDYFSNIDTSKVAKIVDLPSCIDSIRTLKRD